MWTYYKQTEYYSRGFGILGELKCIPCNHIMSSLFKSKYVYMASSLGNTSLRYKERSYIWVFIHKMTWTIVQTSAQNSYKYLKGIFLKNQNSIKCVFAKEKKYVNLKCKEETFA